MTLGSEQGMHRFRVTSVFAARTVVGGNVAIAIAITIMMAVALFCAAPARAQECPGNPDAIGTSRVLTLQPGEMTRVGRMQYPETLPLDDHEVVLTFDDGPLPPHSNQILDILAGQCVKATYFLIGRMAHEFPDVVRRIHAAGHTIGTHSEDHPLRFGKLPIDRMRQEIDNGIADVSAALGDPTALAPFFRVPGLESSPSLESELAAHSLVVFSADAVADDWHRRIKPAQIIERAISRLEVRGRGILLLHDIHPATVAALPGLLTELKAHGFRIVQVVPAILTEPEVLARAVAPTVAWTMLGQDALLDGGAAPHWSNPGDASAAGMTVLAAPDEQSFEIGYALTPTISTGDIEAGDVVADAVPQGAYRSPPALSAAAQWPGPGMLNIGLPIEPPRFIADAIETKSNSEVAGPLGRAKLRHHEFHLQRRAGPHRPVARAGHVAPASHTGRRADLLSGLRALAALAIPRT
jgi:peptidoglycan/xylan/chitin deacetylase (PgdA/CDA1 family)